METKTDPDENQNLEYARSLWVGLCNSRYDPLDRFMHLWRIVDLAEYARLSPVLNQGKKGVYNCISLAVSEDGDEMRGASSVLRATMRINQFDRHPNSTPFKERKHGWAPHGEGAFDDHNAPRLKKVLQREYAEKGLQMPKEPDDKHKYESCSEQVVYEKLSRLGKTPKFVYTLQKTVRNIKAECDVLKYQVKIVHRCRNCMVAKDHLGHVVTDQEPLDGLDVPVVTLSVLKFFRDVTHSHQILQNPSKIKIVWLHLHRFGSLQHEDRIFLSRSGPGGTEFDDEIARALQAAGKQQQSTGALMPQVLQVKQS